MNNYYNLGNLLGRNKIMNIVIGQRGCGAATIAVIISK